MKPCLDKAHEHRAALKIKTDVFLDVFPYEATLYEVDAHLTAHPEGTLSGPSYTLPLPSPDCEKTYAHQSGQRRWGCFDVGHEITGKWNTLEHGPYDGIFDQVTLGLKVRLLNSLLGSGCGCKSSRRCRPACSNH